MQQIRYVYSISVSISDFILKLSAQNTVRSQISNTGGSLRTSFSAQADVPMPVWSQCVGEGGSIPGILNVNLRTAIIGQGTSKLKGAKLEFTWRKCVTDEEELPQ